MKFTCGSLLVAALVPLSLTVPSRAWAKAPSFSPPTQTRRRTGGAHEDGRAFPRLPGPLESPGAGKIPERFQGHGTPARLVIKTPAYGATHVRPDIRPTLTFTAGRHHPGHLPPLTGLLSGARKAVFLAPDAFSAHGRTLSVNLPLLHRYTHYRLWVHPGRPLPHGDLSRPPAAGAETWFETGSNLHEATHMHWTVPAKPTVMAPIPVRVDVTDDYGLAASQGKVTLSLPGKSPVTRTLTPSTQGAVTFHITRHRSGPLVFHLSLKGPYPQDRQSEQGTVDVAPGPPASLSLHPAAPAVIDGVNVPLPLHPALQDRYGNPLPLGHLKVTASGATLAHHGATWSLLPSSGAPSIVVHAADAGLSASATLSVLKAAPAAQLAPTSVSGFAKTPGGYRGSGTLTFAPPKGLLLLKTRVALSGGTVSVHFGGHVYSLSSRQISISGPTGTVTAPLTAGSAPDQAVLEVLKGHTLFAVNGTVLSAPASTTPGGLTVTATGGPVSVGTLWAAAAAKPPVLLVPHQQAVFGGPGLPATTTVRFTGKGNLTVESLALGTLSLRVQIEGGGLNETFTALPPFTRTVHLKGTSVYTVTFYWPDARSSADIIYVGSQASVTPSLRLNP